MNIVKNGFFNHQTEALIREGASAFYSIASKSDAASVVFTGVSCAVVHEAFSNMLAIKADDPHVLTKKFCIVIADVTSALVNMRICTVFTTMSYHHALCISVIVVAAVIQRVAIFSLEMSKKAPVIENQAKVSLPTATQESASVPPLELEEQEPAKSFETILLEAIHRPIPQQVHSARNEVDSLHSFSAIPLWPENQNPKDYRLSTQLSLYCNAYAGSIKEEKVIEFIIKGADFAYKLTHGVDLSLDPTTGKPLSETQVEETLAAYFWYLMATASEKNQAFNEGAIALPDPDKRLFGFLEKFGPKKAYSRDCSHLHTVSKKVLGVDIKNIGPALPGDKKHLMFIWYENHGESWVLIKPENFGVQYPADIVFHGLEYLHSRGRKVWPAAFGRDDEEGMRKERTPEGLINSWKSAAAKCDDYHTTLAQIGNSSGHGIGFQAIYGHVKKWIPILQQQNHTSLKDFENLLQKLKEIDPFTGNPIYDHPEDRFGREVVIKNAIGYRVGLLHREAS